MIVSAEPSAPAATDVSHPRGIRVNLAQFTLQTVQVFFVGLTLGMERTVLPPLSGEFGVAKGAYLFLVSSVFSFGLVKGALNVVAGGLADRIGRKKVLLLGWLAGLPIPLLIFSPRTGGGLLPPMFFLASIRRVPGR